MPANRFRTGYVANSEDGAGLTLETKNGDWQLFYTPAPEALEVAGRDPDFDRSGARILFAEGNSQTDCVTTYPTNTTATSRNFLQPKYNIIRSVVFDGFVAKARWFADEEQGDTWPESVEDVIEFFGELPPGFVRDPYFGLGLNWDFRVVINSIEELEGVNALRIVKIKTSLPAVEESAYSISLNGFDQLRKAINKAHESALTLATKTKFRLAHNALLHAVDPNRFPVQRLSYEKDIISKAVVGATTEKVHLSVADQQAVMSATRTAAKKLSKSDPVKLMELSQEIEVVSLETLITRFKIMLGQRLAEKQWQKFFSLNQFVLRLAFGFPVTKVGDEFSVGSIKFDGSGNKISDFAVKAAATGNLGLIELKTPQTRLLVNKAYRGDLFAPTKELVGAVSQVLDQAYQLQQNISGLKNRSGLWDVETYSVNGLVIAGTMPTERHQVKSFELYRNSHKHVTVVTFDELLQKLQNLLEMLKPSAGESAFEAKTGA